MIEKQLTPMQQEMLDLFQKHVNAEVEGDLDTTMATMSDNPHLHNVPVHMGGLGKNAVRNFYANYLVGRFFPEDVQMNVISRTIDAEQIVEEVVISFTHTMQMDWLLPNVKPTNKPVKVAIVVIVGIKNKKITHEHIYWDQASVLVQVGLLDSKGLPVSGVESAQKILDTIK